MTISRIQNAIQDHAAETGEPAGKVALDVFKCYLRDRGLTAELVTVLRTADTMADPEDMRDAAQDIIVLSKDIARELFYLADENEGLDPFDARADYDRETEGA